MWPKRILLGMALRFITLTIISSTGPLSSAQSEVHDDVETSMPVFGSSADKLTISTRKLASVSAEGQCCTQEIIRYIEEANADFPFAMGYGNEQGLCCVIEKGLEKQSVIKVWSSSKIVTGYAILGLIDQGKLSLDTLASDILTWWTTDPNDDRSLVTVRHLLAQTDGMNTWPAGLGMCSKSTTALCGRDAYDRLFESKPGQEFHYTESSFYILGTIAMELTGHRTFDDVFQELIARPLGMDGCEFSGAITTRKADPGGGLRCSLMEYAKFMTAIYGQTFVSTALHDEAERIQTGSASNMPRTKDLAGSGLYHYALGSWRECLDSNCSDSDGIKIHSMGAGGFLPWIWRRGRESHFGIFAQDGRAGRAIDQTSDVMKNAFPIVREAAVAHHGNGNLTNPSTSTTRPILSSARLQSTELDSVVVLTTLAGLLLHSVEF